MRSHVACGVSLLCFTTLGCSSAPIEAPAVELAPPSAAPSLATAPRGAQFHRCTRSIARTADGYITDFTIRLDDRMRVTRLVVKQTSPTRVFANTDSRYTWTKAGSLARVDEEDLLGGEDGSTTELEHGAHGEIVSKTRTTHEGVQSLLYTWTGTFHPVTEKGAPAQPWETSPPIAYLPNDLVGRSPGATMPPLQFEGRVEVARPDGTLVETHVYDRRGRCTFVDRKEGGYQLELVWRDDVVVLMSGSGFQHDQHYDGTRAVRVERTSVDGAGAVTTYDYDRAGHLVRRVQEDPHEPKEVTTYAPCE